MTTTSAPTAMPLSTASERHRRRSAPSSRKQRRRLPWRPAAGDSRGARKVSAAPSTTRRPSATTPGPTAHRGGLSVRDAHDQQHRGSVGVRQGANRAVHVGLQSLINTSRSTAVRRPRCARCRRQARSQLSDHRLGDHGPSRRSAGCPPRPATSPRPDRRRDRPNMLRPNASVIGRVARAVAPIGRRAGAMALSSGSLRAPQVRKCYVGDPCVSARRADVASRHGGQARGVDPLDDGASARASRSG